MRLIIYIYSCPHLVATHKKNMYLFYHIHEVSHTHTYIYTTLNLFCISAWIYFSLPILEQHKITITSVIRRGFISRYRQQIQLVKLKKVILFR